MERFILGTEKPGNSGEDEADSHNKDNGAEGISRRRFLKQLALGAGLAASGVGLADLLGRDNGQESAEEGKPEAPAPRQEKARSRPKEPAESAAERLESSIRGKWALSPRAEAIRRISPAENMSAEEIAAEFLRLFSDESERAEFLRFFPKEVFEPDFFLAQQFQESRGQKEAVSKSGARGVYQNFPASVADCVDYLSFMRRQGLIPYRGPEKISEQEAAKVIGYFAKHVNYGRAAGKIYLQAIFSPVYKFNTAPNRNIFKGKPPREMQGRLLAAYHDGPAARYKRDQELLEAAKKRASRRGARFSERDTAVHYRETVFGYMADARLVRGKFRESGPELRFEDAAVDRMLHIFEKYSRVAGKDELAEKYRQILLSEIGRAGRDLTRAEIFDLFRPYL